LKMFEWENCPEIEMVSKTMKAGGEEVKKRNCVIMISILILACFLVLCLQIICANNNPKLSNEEYKQRREQALLDAMDEMDWINNEVKEKTKQIVLDFNEMEE